MRETLNDPDGEGGDLPAEGGEPSLPELSDALAEHLNRDGAVTPGAVRRLVAERHWSGRTVDVLGIVAENSERMGFMAGGRRPDEVATWVAIWADCPLSLDEIRLVASAGGWDPEPFAVLAREGLLESFLRGPDGSTRRVRGELAGTWASDELALSDDDEVVEVARQIIAGAEPISGGRPDP
jgi:hypothetical protein